MALKREHWGLVGTALEQYSNSISNKWGKKQQYILSTVDLYNLEATAVNYLSDSRLVYCFMTACIEASPNSLLKWVIKLQ